MAELVDAHGLGPCAVRLGGSSPFIRTINMFARELDIRNQSTQNLQVALYGSRVMFSYLISELPRARTNPDSFLIGDPSNELARRIRASHNRASVIKQELNIRGVETDVNTTEQAVNDPSGR